MGVRIEQDDGHGLAIGRVLLFDQLGLSAVLDDALVVVDDDLLQEELPALPRASEVDEVFRVLDEDVFVLDGAVVATAVVAVAADLVTVNQFNSNMQDGINT